MDFTTAQKFQARKLLAAPHVAHVQVVSSADDRHERFREVNLELARVSNICLCLVGPAPAGKPGGTMDLVKYARRRRRPTLLICVTTKEGEPIFTEEKSDWPTGDAKTDSGKLPRLPAPLDGIRLPAPTITPPCGVPLHARDYFEALKQFGSGVARANRDHFKRAAVVVIGTHFVATLCAVAALGFHEFRFLPALLVVEIVLLLAGWGVHMVLHHFQPAKIWAVSRLTAELSASGKAVAGCHLQLDYLFDLPFPPTLRPLLRTANVLHLASSRLTAASLAGQMATYVSGPSGRFGDRDQVAHFLTNLPKDHCKRRRADLVFQTCAWGAIAATALKLSLPHGAWTTPLGMLGVVLPVVAVGALSLAAAFGLEARVHTYLDTLSFLNPRIAARVAADIEMTSPRLPAEAGLVELLKNADTELEFHRLVLETETILMGELANWTSRRAFLPVA